MLGGTHKSLFKTPLAFKPSPMAAAPASPILLMLRLRVFNTPLNSYE